MRGAGKYDDACTVARESTDAAGAVLIILDGKQGYGFSVQVPPVALFRLPDLLENMAKQIRADLEQYKA